MILYRAVMMPIGLCVGLGLVAVAVFLDLIHARRAATALWDYLVEFNCFIEL